MPESPSTDTPFDLIPLAQMPTGQCGVIAEVLGHTEQVHRLNELGFRRGVSVEMVQPGSPCILKLATHKFCFRADDLFNVLVRPGVDP